MSTSETSDGNAQCMDCGDGGGRSIRRTVDIRVRSAGHESREVGVIRGLDVDAVCARSHYFTALLCGTFSEAGLGVVPIVLPLTECVTDADLARLGAILDGSQAPTPRDAVLFWDAFSFIGADTCLAECSAAMTLIDYLRPTETSDMPSASSVLSICALRLSAQSNDDDGDDDDDSGNGARLQAAISVPEPALFASGMLWDVFDAMHDNAIGGDRTLCQTNPLYARFFGAYVSLGRALLAASTDLVQSTDASSDDLRILTADRPGLLAAATAMAMRDWYRPLAAIHRAMDVTFDMGTCDILAAGAARLFDTHATCEASSSSSSSPSGGVLVPCFVESLDAFRRALVDDFPVVGPALLASGILGRGGGVVMAGGSVVNAMQSVQLRRRLPSSDIDLWIVGPDEDSRRRSFANAVQALCDALPQCCVRTCGSVVTLFARPPRESPYAPHARVATDGDGVDRMEDGRVDVGPAAGVDDSHVDPAGHGVGEDDDDCIERIQIIYTEYIAPHEVVLDFDMSHACAYYDGDNVMATWACVWACVSRTTEPLVGMTPKQARIDKAQAKGFAPAFDVTPSPPPSGPAGASNVALTYDDSLDRPIPTRWHRRASDVIASFGYSSIVSNAHVHALPEASHMMESLIRFDCGICLRMPILWAPNGGRCGPCSMARFGRSPGTGCACSTPGVPLPPGTTYTMQACVHSDFVSEEGALDPRASSFIDRLTRIDQAAEASHRSGAHWHSSLPKLSPDGHRYAKIKYNHLTLMTDAVTGARLEAHELRPHAWIDGSLWAGGVAAFQNETRMLWVRCLAMRVYPPCLPRLVRAMRDAISGGAPAAAAASGDAKGKDRMDADA